MIGIRLVLTMGHDRFKEGSTSHGSLAVSPDGRCFATATEYCDIALWDTHTGAHIATLEHAGETYSLEFLADGHLTSGNDDGKVSVWDTVTGTHVRTVDAHSDQITGLSASQSKLASGSKDKKVRVWDTETWECMRMFECDQEVVSVVLYPNGDRVAACTNWMLYVWNTETQQLIASKNINYCQSVAVSNDGKWLAVASDVYDASTFDCIWSHHRGSDSVSFSPDSSQLVSASYIDDKVSLIDVQTGKIVKSFQHDLGWRAIFSHDGTRVLSGESCSVPL